jgi:DNA-directed RNA polymerase specialized sigma24 family protein
VIEALAEMQDGDRELLMLIGVEGLTPSQAARVLGISSVTARTRLHRARRRLRALLLDQAGEKNNNEMEMGEA